MPRALFVRHAAQVMHMSIREHVKGVIEIDKCTLSHDSKRMSTIFLTVQVLMRPLPCMVRGPPRVYNAILGHHLLDPQAFVHPATWVTLVTLHCDWLVVLISLFAIQTPSNILPIIVKTQANFLSQRMITRIAAAKQFCTMTAMSHNQDLFLIQREWRI